MPRSATLYATGPLMPRRSPSGPVASITSKPAGLQAQASHLGLPAMSLHQHLRVNVSSYDFDGYGILVRIMDDGFNNHNDIQKAVVATNWSKYIDAPTQAFPSGDPGQFSDFKNPVLMSLCQEQ
eukprot:gene10279-8201_t